jgi:hypothetical protein
MLGVLFVAERPMMLKSLGWHDTQPGLDASTCMSWLKVTTPGLSPDRGSFRAPGRSGRSLARAAPPSRSAASIGMRAREVMVASV